MPHACVWAASGVIGNELFIAGGTGLSELNTLQIYDIAARTWRLGAPLPVVQITGSKKPRGVDVDGKLFLFTRQIHRTLVYDPLYNMWTEEAVPEGDFSVWYGGACAHEGRVFVIGRTGNFLRAADGSWSFSIRAEDGGDSRRSLSGSVLLG